MRQILFHVPFFDLPIYGYGLMLFFAFIFCSWLARRMCKHENIDPDIIPDLAICLFITGIVGGRLVFIIQYWDSFHNRGWFDLVKLWDGGLVLYGALFGGTLGYFMYHRFALAQRGISHWQMFDIIAPCVALGISFGRIGCLFTGCCFGNVACESCPAIHFPVYTNSAPPSLSGAVGKMVQQGYQSPLGFVYDERNFKVEAVEPGSPADLAHLRVGDVIVDVNGKDPHNLPYLLPGDDGLSLKVMRDGKTVALPPFEPVSIGLNPTQIYETISMCLLVFFLLSYYPYKQRDGELMVWLMLVYAVHRFLNEMLRTDTDPVAFGLTLSQNVSIGIFALGMVLAYTIWQHPPPQPQPAESESSAPPPATDRAEGMGTAP